MPKPGDVIQTIWNDRSYEIADVHEEENIFQLKKLVWNFVLRPYRFSEQSTDANQILDFTNISGEEKHVTRPPTDPAIETYHDGASRYTESTPVTAFGDNSIYGY